MTLVGKVKAWENQGSKPTKQKDLDRITSCLLVCFHTGAAPSPSPKEPIATLMRHLTTLQLLQKAQSLSEELTIF